MNGDSTQTGPRGRLWLHPRIVLVWVLLAASIACAPGARALGLGRSGPFSLHPASSQSMSSTSTTSGPAAVGALFASADADEHSCSASVVHSAAGDLVVTAAHCVTGSGAGMRFAPGYADGRAPYGYWTVTKAYATTGWLTGQKASDDVVVLRVASRTMGSQVRTLESVVGALDLGTTPASGTRVTVMGYASGSGDSAITCSTSTSMTEADGVAYPTFTCGSFPGGTSGGPWVATVKGRATIVGLIGGLHQGGCTDETSYSSPVGQTVAQLVARAASGHGDVLPSPASSGC